MLDAGFTDTVTSTTYTAFRDARADADTDCSGDYLTGQSGEDINSYKCVYWTGSGFTVAFRKIDGSGASLAGATFTLYKANEAGTDKEGDAIATATSGKGVAEDTQRGTTAADPAVILVEGSGESASAVPVSVYDSALVVFEKVSAGVYFLVETGLPAIREAQEGEEASSIPTWQPVEEKYRLVVDSDGCYVMYVADCSTGAAVWKTYSTDVDNNVTWSEAQAPTQAFVETAADSGIYAVNGAGTKTVNVYAALNVSPLTRKAILRKVDAADHTPLPGAKFTVYYADGQTPVKVTNTSGSITVLKDLESLDSGAFWIGNLPYGTYTIEETTVPGGYATAAGSTTNRFTLTVSEDGVGSTAYSHKLSPDA